MKRFNGLVPFSFETLFGIIAPVEIDDGYFKIEQITDTSVRFPHQLRLRKYKSKAKALKAVQHFERTEINQLTSLIDNVTKRVSEYEEERIKMCS